MHSGLEVYTKTMNRTEIKALALQLSSEDRAELVHELLETLETPSSEEIERRWAKVIERRVDELRSGQVKGVPAEEVMRTLRGIVDSDLPS